MKVYVDRWSVTDHGVPAMSTRQERADGSVTYDGIYDVSLHLTVVGNHEDAYGFLNGLSKGVSVKGIELGSGKATKAKAGRKYVFD